MLVSSTAGDPSTDWELIELDDDQDDNSQAEASAGNESFVESAENRIIGNELVWIILGTGRKSKYLKRPTAKWPSGVCKTISH